MGVTLLRPPPEDLSVAVMVVRYLQNDYRGIFQRIHLSTQDRPTIVTEFNAYRDVVKALFDSSWHVDLTALWLINAGVPERVGVPVATGAAGTNTTTTPAINGIIRSTYVFATENPGHHNPIHFIGPAEAVLQAPYGVSSSAGGTAAERAFVGYVTGTTTHIVAHDGTRLQSPARVLTCLDKGSRRKGLRVA